MSTLLGTIGAIGSFLRWEKSGQCINFLNQIPIANAEVVTGFSICVLMIVLFGVDKDTYLPLLVGQTVLCAPFAYLSVLPKLKQMDPNLYEAAFGPWLQSQTGFVARDCARNHAGHYIRIYVVCHVVTG